MIGPASMVLIILVALIIFGPTKLPELGRALGTTLREFKKATNGIVDQDEEAKKTNSEVK